MSGFSDLYKIDQEIDAVRDALLQRVGHIRKHSAASWQKAWDRCPDLREKELALFAERGRLQAAQAQAEYDQLKRRRL